jgi:hypothetical protein
VGTVKGLLENKTEPNQNQIKMKITIQLSGAHYRLVSVDGQHEGDLVELGRVAHLQVPSPDPALLQPVRYMALVIDAGDDTESGFGDYWVVRYTPIKDANVSFVDVEFVDSTDTGIGIVRTPEEAAGGDEVDTPGKGDSVGGSPCKS